MIKDNSNFIIGQILKILQKSQISSEEDETDSKYVSSSNILNIKDEKNDKKIIVKKKERIFERKIYKLLPNLETNHIYRLFGVLHSLFSFSESTKRRSKAQGYNNQTFTITFRADLLKKLRFITTRSFSRCQPLKFHLTNHQCNRKLKQIISH